MSETPTAPATAPAAGEVSAVSAAYAQRSGLSVFSLLTGIVLVLVLIATAAVSLTSYVTGRNTLEQLWQELAKNLGQLTVERTLRHLEPARTRLHLARGLVDAGRIDPHDRNMMIRHVRAELEAFPTFTWAAWGDADGTYVAAYRGPAGEHLSSIRVMKPEANDRVPKKDGELADVALYQQERRDELGRWLPDTSFFKRYDPRVRPWYQVAVDAGDDGEAWVDPFIFASRGQPGVSHSGMQIGRDGKPMGVWVVDYEMRELSDFLKSPTMRPGEHGRVAVIAASGAIVAHPDGEIVKIDGERRSVMMVDDHPDRELAEAWKLYQEKGGGTLSFRSHGHAIAARPLSPDHGLDWTVIMIVDEDDFFGDVRRQLNLSLLVGLISLLCAVGIGLFLSRKIASSIEVLTAEFEHIAELDLDAVDEERLMQPSMIKEINTLRLATLRMEKSLRSFSRYVPASLVRKLMRSGLEARLGGDVRELTVLFADLAGFTTAAESVEPAALVEGMGVYFDAMGSEVVATDGTIDKYIGDAIMAFWGAPTPVEGHAAKAAAAALAIKSRIDHLRENAAKDAPAFHIRVGLNTGEALVGNIGAVRRFDYTALGATVNLASRLEGLNKAYGTSILLGDATAAALPDGAFLLRPVDWVRVKGARLPVLVSELLARGADATEALSSAVWSYREGLDAYKERRFEQAIERFEEARERFGGQDEPSAIMIARCTTYLESPPPEDWDGVFTMTTK